MQQTFPLCHVRNKWALGLFANHKQGGDPCSDE